MTFLTWAEDAACGGYDLNVFFGAEGERAADRPHREAKAKLVCRECPVARQCLNEALIEDIRYGVWGGTDPDERRNLRRRLARRGELPERAPAAKEHAMQRRKTGTGECVECGATMGLTSGGNVSRHGPRGDWCAGSGLPPAEVTAVAS